MYMLFSLGRADVLAVDDLAVKVATMDLLELTARPIPKQLISLIALHIKVQQVYYCESITAG